MDKKQIAIFGGGTVQWIASHLALSAPAYGTTARQLAEICKRDWPEMDVKLHLTKMAGGDPNLETNEDIARVIGEILQGDLVKVVFMNAALVDFRAVLQHPWSHTEHFHGGKYGTRISSRERSIIGFQFKRLPKVIEDIRRHRKDIFLVGFKQTCGATVAEQYIEGLRLCKLASCNLVFANDTKTRMNMVVTPEEARYWVTEDREVALKGLVEMTKHRSHLTFTRSTVVNGESVPWESALVPHSLRTVVNHCIANGAYKAFKPNPNERGTGSTVGHFAVKVNDTTFLTSKRRTNFNDLEEHGLVKIETDGPDTVIAYGAKPSVGGQSQRIVFEDHPDLDCIVHFHCPKKEGSKVPEVSQYEFECGSHECGNNTSKGLQRFGNLYAVYLQEHGPNIVFNRDIDPEEVITFIDDNFDLSDKTGGFVSIERRLNTPNTAQEAKRLLGIDSK